GAVDGARLLWVTFLGEARKVTSRRAAPGNKIRRGAHPTATKSHHAAQCPLVIAPYAGLWNKVKDRPFRDGFDLPQKHEQEHNDLL
ncbi:MAG: hypothetical protein ABFE02_00550, partial [Sulfuricella sp.]